MNTINKRIIKLSDLIDTGDIEGIKNYLKTFKCKKNRDVEIFLHQKAIESNIRSFSRTYILINEDDKSIIGYFTLLAKSFNFKNNVSNNVRGKITGNKRSTDFTTILIAQLGKDDTYRTSYLGSNLIDDALEVCKNIKEDVGLRIVCVEHDKINKLDDFYVSNGFKELQTNENEKIMRYKKI